MTEVQKRKRGVNFSRDETDLLIELVTKYKNVIENKKSDAVTWKEKEKIWDEIEKEFNSVTGEIRTAKCLKNKYDILKKETRKKNAAIRQSIFKTGGGTECTPSLDPAEEKIKSLIYTSVEGVENRFDSDTILTNTVNVEKINEPIIVEIPQTNTIGDLPTIDTINQEDKGYVEVWETWNPNILKTPINPSLKKGKSVNNRIMHERYAELAERKIKLTETKEELLRKEYEQKAEKHKIEMEILKIELEIKKRKLSGCNCN